MATTGCPSNSNHSESISDGSSPAIESVSVNDRLGHEVHFAKSPARVISLSPSTTELMFAIGAGESIVGVTKHCDYPQAALSIPRVGGDTLEGLSRETIISLEPDLVLCKWDNHEPLFELFDLLDIPYIAVGPGSLSELYDEAAMLGRITDNRPNADALIRRMTTRHQRLTQRVAKFTPPERLSVFYEVWDDPLMTAGPDSFIGELLSDAGLENIFADTDLRFPRVSSEVVVDRNPQLILAPSNHAERVTVESLSQRPGWKEVRAVKNQRVYIVDRDQISRCGPRLLDALEQVINAAYPLEPNVNEEPK
ncbi:MAG: cobalamin-binding protein [bacterium]|nr:cobalamin-binding protein [bacterium]